jgi:hypothetical protein
MLFGSLSPVTAEPERSSGRRLLLDQLLQTARNAFPEVEVLIYEANSSFNAQAFTLGSQQIVTLFGGLAFNRHMGKDGLLFTILHEIGHHRGAGPRMTQTSILCCDCTADRWAIVEGQDTILSHGLTLDINSALSQIEAAMSELGGMLDLTAQSWCFDWARRKITLSLPFLQSMKECEYRVSLDNPMGGKNGISDSERRRHERHQQT